MQNELERSAKSASFHTGEGLKMRQSQPFESLLHFIQKVIPHSKTSYALTASALRKSPYFAHKSAIWRMAVGTAVLGD